ncbi:MAG: superoxide dismutase [Candidatus Kerfeldbacteria bacterium]|nr:superoxide dismutase [Candidatus Kerfeldbacteria bacterium]
MSYVPKDLPFSMKSLKGISEKAMQIHHDKLYAGYVTKKNEIQEKLESVELDTANATYSALRALKAEESFAVNGVYLHEYYFAVLGGDGAPSGALKARIEKDFGSYESWDAMFKACGLAARGWVVLAWDTHEERLRIYTGDTHNQGAVWGAIPLITLDVFEHAYFMDYGSDRPSYIKDFMAQLNWKTANGRFARFAR